MLISNGSSDSAKVRQLSAIEPLRFSGPFSLWAQFRVPHHRSYSLAPRFLWKAAPASSPTPFFGLSHCFQPSNRIPPQIICGMVSFRRLSYSENGDSIVQVPLKSLIALFLSVWHQSGYCMLLIVSFVRCHCKRCSTICRKIENMYLIKYREWWVNGLA